MNDIFEQLRSPNNVSDFVYHYTKSNTALEKILPTMTLKLSSLNTSNDPLEFSEYYPSGGGMVGNDFDEKFILFALKSNRINTILKNGIKYASFSRDIDNDDREGLFNKGFARSRMWAQYSDKHCGVSLVFSKIELLNNLNTESKKYEGSIVIQGNVEYDDELSELKEALYVNMDGKDLITDDLDHVKRYKEAYLLTKNKDFRDEQEYRIAIYHKSFEDTDSITISIQNALIGIVLGIRCPEVYDVVFNELSIKHGFGVYSMYWRNGEPILLKKDELTRR